MAIYLSETDLVRALALQFRRAANAAEDIAADVSSALRLSALESSATGDAILLAENLDRVAVDLRHQSLQLDELVSKPVAVDLPKSVSGISANQIPG